MPFRFLAAGLLCCLAASPLAAQFAPLTVPRGTAALELLPRFESWDRRYLSGRAEPSGADFGRDAIGASLFPALADAEQRLARLTGIPGTQLNAGRFRATQVTTVGEFAIGLRLGVTRRLTLSGLVPFQRVRVETITSFDSTDATSGFNPADPIFGTTGGQGATATFFLEFDQAIAALADGLANGTWAGDPALHALATATLGEATSMRDDLHGLLLAPDTRSPFVPLDASAGGLALLARLGALQQRFADDLGIGGFSGGPALAPARLSPADWDRFLTDPAGPIAGSLTAPIYTALGDIEIGAAWLLAERAALPGRTGFRSVVQGTVRLRTSQLDTPERFFDRGTGDRQPDAEVALVTDLARGRAALRLAGWYTAQLPGIEPRRIGHPSQPIQYAGTLATVRRDPGDVIAVAALPAYRLTPGFALFAGVEWWSRGADRYDWAADQTPLQGLDPAVLGEDSAARAVTLRTGLTWSHSGTRRDGSAGAPLDASLSWDRVVSASGGRVPQSQTVRAMLRIYQRIW